VSITIGTPLGSYEITALLGKGGMGEVYRARDTKLKRDVAIKILPDEFSRDPDRVTRFEREAQVLALLNDARIGAIYGLEEFKSKRFLVLELVNGPTLAERITRGALPLDEALVIAAQIADALEYAHERNVIHRDLKPANIKLTADGSVKVLDFGLAKALADPALSTDPADSPTFTTGPTGAGVILGTAAYMSPEQAQGKALDKRTDIWSYGVVLYEMLTGKPPFAGETTADALASILKEAPDLDRAPPNIRPLLRKCLEKDQRQRLRDIGDAKVLLDNPPVAQETRHLWPWIVGVALTSVLALTASVGWWRATRPIMHPLIRISAELSGVQQGRYRLDSETTLASSAVSHLALSADGTRLALGVLDADGQVRLATRRLDDRTFASLRGAENVSSPFFSPDGQWIAFFGNGKLQKIPAQGGAPIILCDALPFASGTWGDDGNIIAALDGLGGRLSRVSSDGTRTPLAELGPDERGHAWPQVLPGSKAILFTVYTAGGVEDSRIDVLSFGTHERKTVMHGGIMGRYLGTSAGGGYLVYVHQNTFLAAPFDAGRLVVTGAAQPILDDVSAMTASNSADFDFSRNGTLVYLSGKGEPERSIFWLDSWGQKQPLHPNARLLQRSALLAGWHAPAVCHGRPSRSPGSLDSDIGTEACSASHVSPAPRPLARVVSRWYAHSLCRRVSTDRHLLDAFRCCRRTTVTRHYD
jgi:serine/threonine-protein kinase